MAVDPLPPGPGKPQQGWGVVKFQSATIALLLLASVVVATSPVGADGAAVAREIVIWVITHAEAPVPLRERTR